MAATGAEKWGRGDNRCSRSDKAIFLLGMRCPAFQLLRSEPDEHVAGTALGCLHAVHVAGGTHPKVGGKACRDAKSKARAFGRKRDDRALDGRRTRDEQPRGNRRAGWATARAITASGRWFSHGKEMLVDWS